MQAILVSYEPDYIYNVICSVKGRIGFRLYDKISTLSVSYTFEFNDVQRM